jgi:hypothetical protein
MSDLHFAFYREDLSISLDDSMIILPINGKTIETLAEAIFYVRQEIRERNAAQQSVQADTPRKCNCNANSEIEGDFHTLGCPLHPRNKPRTGRVIT